MMDCKFCSPSGDVRVPYGTVYAVMDKYPVTHGHVLVIPYRHCLDYFDLSAQEKLDTDAAFRDIRLGAGLDITGFNIGWNCGVSAGQTVMHAHAHVIPRRTGDRVAPEGGVRGVIPSKQRY